MTIFLTTTTLFTGLIYRDRYYSDQIRSELVAEAAKLSEVPMKPSERARKIVVYVMKPEKDGFWRTRKWFKDYVKPVFDAASLDYDLIELSTPGALKSAVSSHIIKKYQSSASSPPSATDRYNAILRASPMDDLNTLFGWDDYDGFITMGRKGWEELLKGVEEGWKACFQSSFHSHLSKPDVTLSSSEPENSASSTTPQASNSWFSWFKSSSSAQSSPVTSTTPQISTQLPPLGYIPFYTLSGWSTLPIRIYRWFHDYQKVEAIGKIALCIAKREIRELKEDDVWVGLSESQKHKVKNEMMKRQESGEEWDVVTPEMVKFFLEEEQSKDTKEGDKDKEKSVDEANSDQPIESTLTEESTAEPPLSSSTESSPKSKTSAESAPDTSSKSTKNSLLKSYYTPKVIPLFNSSNTDNQRLVEELKVHELDGWDQVVMG